MADTFNSEGGYDMGAHDSRDHRPNYDLNRIDFEWVAKSEDKKELHKAYKALKEDSGFPDLMRAVEEKLKGLDPIFRRKVEGDKVTHED